MAHKKGALIGFSLALVTAILWGTVPIAVKQVLPNMSPLTIVWYRFTIAGVLLFLILTIKKQLPPLNIVIKPRNLILFIAGTLGIAGNFVLFSASLQYVSPTTTQLVAQLSTVGLMICSIWVFNEKMTKIQIIGIIVLLLGLALFFNTSLITMFTEFSDYSFGIMLVACAGMIWVVYGLVQKILLSVLSAQQILVVIYLLCAFLLFFFAKKAQIFDLTRGQFLWLVYAGVNTLIGYGALAEAMHYWRVSKVSAVVTFTPLFTLLFSDILALIWPDIFIFAKLNILAYLGAFAVVGGAVIAVTGKNQKSAAK